ncbi:MAG: hypothetical protein LH606_15830 [Cytophagaceae bacterium]|nr:hypothetical protein [Cytophagaceae bacterium]
MSQLAAGRPTAFVPSTALTAFVGLTNTRLEIYRWAADHLADADLREVFVALLQQAKVFKRQLGEVAGGRAGGAPLFGPMPTMHRIGDTLPTLRTASLLPRQSANVNALYDLLDQLNEAETYAIAQLKADGLLQRAIRAQRNATRTLHEALDYLRQYV